MNEWGVIINDQLIIHKTKQPGDKSVIRTERPIEPGYYFTFYWAETDVQILQVWEAHEDPEGVSE